MPDHMLVPVGFGLVSLRWRLAGDSEEMVSTIGVQPDVGDPDGGDALAALVTNWNEGWTAATLHVDWTMVGATIRMGPLGEGPVSEGHVDMAGTASGESLPSNCCFLVRKVTGLGGRRGRGRMFLPSGYISHEKVDARGVIEGGELSDAQALLTAFQTACSVTDVATIGGLWLFHNVPAGADPDLHPPTQITALRLQPRIATQRRRMAP